MTNLIYYGADPTWKGGEIDYKSIFEEIVSHRFALHGPNTKKVFLDEAIKSGVCIFCNRSHPEVDFLDDSHAFPACCGNRDLFFHDECHECNVTYGRECEDQLGNFLIGYRALMGVRGREGVPKLKISDDSRGYIGGSEYLGLVKIVTADDNDSVKTTLDEASKTLTLEFRVPSFRPVSAMKSVLRSAWMSLGTRRSDFTFLLDIIQNKGEIFPFEFHEGLLPGAEPNSAEFNVWRRIACDPAVPPLIVHFRIGHIFLVWFAPVEGLNKYVPFCLPPVVSHPDAPKPTCIRMSVPSDDRLNPKTVSYSFVYDHIDKTGKEDHSTRVKRSDLKRPKSSFKVALECRKDGNVLAQINETYARLADDQETQQTVNITGGMLAANFTFTFYKGTPNGKLDFALRFDSVSRANAKSTIGLLKACHSESSSLWAVGEELGAPLELGSANGIPIQVLDYYEKVIEWVESIETTFQLTLKLDKLSKPDLEIVGILGNAMQRGVVRINGEYAGPQHVNLTKAFAELIFDKIKANQDFSTDCEMTFLVAGKQINVGRMNIVYHSPRSLLSAEDVETKIKGMSDSDVLVVPIMTDSVVMVFDRWYKKN
jgi:hypothetical protein